MISNKVRIIRFGNLEIDVHAGELRRNGVLVKLQEQPFQILVLLLERNGGVVTREELKSQLWSSDTFVDFDHSLNAAVRRLRDALGDNAESPRFVGTVARRGYRFLAPLTEIQSVPVSESLTERLRSTIKWKVSTLAGVLLVGGLGLFVGRISRPEPSFTAQRRVLTNLDEMGLTEQQTADSRAAEKRAKAAMKARQEQEKLENVAAKLEKKRVKAETKKEKTDGELRAF